MTSIESLLQVPKPVQRPKPSHHDCGAKGEKSLAQNSRRARPIWWNSAGQPRSNAAISFEVMRRPPVTSFGRGHRTKIEKDRPRFRSAYRASKEREERGHENGGRLLGPNFRRKRRAIRC